MLKKTITYKNFDNETVTDDFYFNLTKAELVELEVSEKEGIAETLQAIVNAEDRAMIIEYFKKIILLAYGERSSDGRKFIKSPDIANAFSHTEAYSELFMELSSDAKAAAMFVNGIMPASLMVETAPLPDTDTTPEMLLVPSNPTPEAKLPQDVIEAMSKEELVAWVQANTQ